jgi:hypothetical protein
MKNIRFIVKVNRGGTRAPRYVQRIDRAPIRTTTNRKLAYRLASHRELAYPCYY